MAHSRRLTCLCPFSRSCSHWLRLWIEAHLLNRSELQNNVGSFAGRTFLEMLVVKIRPVDACLLNSLNPPVLAVECTSNFECCRRIHGERITL